MRTGFEIARDRAVEYLVGWTLAGRTWPIRMADLTRNAGSMDSALNHRAAVAALHHLNIRVPRARNQFIKAA